MRTSPSTAGTGTRAPRRIALGGLSLVLALVLVFGAVLGAVVGRLGSSLPLETVQAWAWLLVVVTVALIVTSVRHFTRRDWFHPLAFPLMFVSVVLTIPIVYLVIARQRIGAIEPDEVSVALVLVFILTIAGLYVGTWAGLALPVRSSLSRSYVVNYQRLRRIGRGMVFVCIPPELIRVATSRGRAYGYGAVSFDLSHAIASFVASLLFTGAALICISNGNLGQRIFKRIDYILVGTFALITLSSGNRGELVPVVLVALWAHHTYLRPIRVRAAAAVTIAVVVLFYTVGRARVGADVFAGKSAFTERVIAEIANPVYVTLTLMDFVPRRHGFEGGSTYLEALKRQLPGPISVSVFGPPTNTGSYGFRRIIGFTNPNAGQAFSLPSEAYLNFGVSGSAVPACVVGLAFGLAYRRCKRPPYRVTHVLYGLMVATLPVTLSTDALVQIKAVLYPAVLIALALALARSQPGRQGSGVPSGGGETRAVQSGQPEPVSAGA